MLLLSSSQTLWMGLSSADLPGPAASEGTGSPLLPASQPGAHRLMESGLSVCLDRHPARDVCCRSGTSSAAGKVQIYHVRGHTATAVFWQR